MSRAVVARLACALAYPPLAYWAVHAGSGGAAALALGDLALVFLAEPLLRPRAWAWAVAALLAAGLGALAAGSEIPQMLLLAPPVLFLALLSWVFGRSLRAPRVPLIERIVTAVYAQANAPLPPELPRYARRLTAAWALLLATLALVNGALAFAEVPGGVLARLGHAPGWAIPRDQGALIANLVNYGVVGAFFVGEYLLRKRWFPHRPYRHFFDFVHRMARLGPDFWKGLLR
jgi:uncharacterized membrane protein